MTRIRSVFFAVLACWAAFVTVGYVQSHRRQIDLARDCVKMWRQSPVTVSSAMGTAPFHLKALAATGAGLLAAWFAGRPVAAWFGGASAPLRLATGLGWASLGVLGAGLAGLLHPVLMAVCAGMAALSAVACRRRAIRGAERLSVAPALTPPALLIAILLIAILSAFVNLLGALAPEIGYDSLIQHLADPVNYLRARRVYFNDLSFLAQHPAGIQMLYGWLIPMGGDRAAALLHWSFGVLCFWTFRHWLRRWWHASDATVLACGLYLTPFFGVLSSRAYVDLGLVFFSCAALAAPWGSCLQGAMIGAAIGAKYNGGVLLLAWAGMLFFSAGPRAALRVAFAAALGGICWGARNWLNTGNPVYPFLYGVFGGLGWDAHSAAEYQGEITSYGQVSGLSGILALPWLSFVRDRGALDDGSLGTLALIGAPLLIMGGGRTLKRLGWLSAGLWLFYCFSPRQVRYALPYVPPMLGSVFLALRESCQEGSRRKVRSGSAFLLALLALQFLVSVGAVYVWSNPYPVDFGAISQSRYLALIMEPRDARTGHSLYMRAAGMVRESLRERERGYMLGDAKVYYVPGDWIVNALFNPPLLKGMARDSFSSAQLEKKMRQRGITHVLYNVGGSIHIEFTHHLFSFSDRELAVVENLFRSRLMRLWTLETSDKDPMYVLYRLRRGSYALPPYLPGVDTRIAAVEERVGRGEKESARVLAGDLVRDYPSSRFLKRRLEGILAESRQGPVD